MGHIAVAVDATETWGDEFLVIQGGLSEHKKALGDLVVLQVGSDAWFHPELVGKGPAARSFHCGAAIGSRLYLFGGHVWVKEKKGLQKFNDLWCLDTSTWEWTLVDTPADSASPSPRDFASLVCLEGSRLLLFGGLDSHEKRQDDSWIFDAVTSTWTELKVAGLKPKARYAHCMTRVDQRVLMFGGESNTGLVADLWTLRGLGLQGEEAPVWIPLDLPGAPPSARKGHALASLGWWLVVMGGRTAEISWFRSKTDIFHSDVVVVDRQGTMQWRSPVLIGDSPPAREFHTLTALSGGRLLLFGGGNGKVIFGDAWWLDTEDDGALLATLSSLSDTTGPSQASMTERLKVHHQQQQAQAATALQLPDGQPWWKGAHSPDDVRAFERLRTLLGLQPSCEGASGSAQMDDVSNTAGPGSAESFSRGHAETAVAELGAELLQQQGAAGWHSASSPNGYQAPTQAIEKAVRAYFSELDPQDLRLIDLDPLLSALIAYHVPLRLVRDVITAASIAADYKWSQRSSLGLTEQDQQGARRACHRRSAFKLQRLCFANAGVYIKLGQHIAQLDHLLPAEYVQTMREHMLHRCPASPYSDIAQIIEQDFGKPPEELFADFSPTPVASASLAQVHVAHTFDGQKLAVKVQHSGLRDTSSADVATIEVLVKVVHWLLPDFNYSWLVDEAKESLPKELDFHQEAVNAERCRRNLASDKSSVRGRVVVPKIYHETSSARVLTMEFIEGAMVTEKDALQQMGIVSRELAQLVAETFNEMIFRMGFIHCDPHAANLLVRKHEGRMQLVLLDHGLYRQIDDKFRREYAGLWKSLIFADAEGIKRHSASMNAGDAYQLFAGMLTNRPWSQITKQSADHLAIPNSAEERALAQEYAQHMAKEISSLLWRMPRVLLLLLKTNDCLRSIDFALGQPINTFVITARECTRALGEFRLAEQPGWRSRVAVTSDAAQCMGTLEVVARYHI
ncbi:hypothetical protein WJX72_001997 [[Myrmecia] bisecta]|uniref:ABC1 atypical kinase-like domain-containing protein n=1 Tax=[Myrmecia] bisecta TaxID=41462 RepID=A0AAW1QQ34_9CHLO